MCRRDWAGGQGQESGRLRSAAAAPVPVSRALFSAVFPGRMAWDFAGCGTPSIGIHAESG